MLKKIASLVMVIALVSTLSGSVAFAKSPTQPDVKGNANEPAETEVPDKNKVQPNEQLKTAMAKLVADTKAGKVAPAPKWQLQPAKSNNLSTGTKIAIGVGIAAAVIAVVFIVKYSNNER